MCTCVDGTVFGDLTDGKRNIEARSGGQVEECSNCFSVRYFSHVFFILLLTLGLRSGCKTRVWVGRELYWLAVTHVVVIQHPIDGIFLVDVYESIDTITDEIESNKSRWFECTDLEFLFEMMNHRLDCFRSVARNQSVVNIDYNDSDFFTDTTSVDARVTFTANKAKLDEECIEFLVPFVRSLFEAVE